MNDTERAELRFILDLVEQLPSGIDTEAREDNTSPEDMVAHIGGLIWQRLTAMLEEP